MFVRHLCLICLCAAVAGCASTDTSDAEGGAAAVPDTGYVGDVALSDVSSRDTAGGCEGVLPGTDSDGDGLDDVVEDTNRNCVLDEGETDPQAADTDGDGLLDGDEDVDRNGVWDAGRGELDPRQADTDGDGVLDANEPLARVCSSALLLDVTRHRVASGESVFFIDPVLQATSMLGGRGMLVVDAGAPRAAMLVSSVAEPLRVDEIVALVEEGARALGADVWWESETAGAVRMLTLAIDLPQYLPLTDVVESLLGALNDEDIEVPPSEVGTARRYALRIEAEARPGALLNGRVAIALSGEGDPTDWFRSMGVGAIAPDRESTLRARCEVIETSGVEQVDVVVAWAPSLAVETGLEDVVSAIGGLLAARSDEDRVTRVWLVPADGHAVETAGRVAGSGAFGRVEQLFDAALAVEALTDDQRVWLNALAFVEGLDERVEGVEQVEVIALLGREDSEFRLGERNGRDGAPDGAPLSAGPARDARTGWYAERFASLGVSVTGVALRPGAAPGCGRDLRGDEGAPLEPAMSARDIAMATGGTFVELCAPDLERTLESGLVRSAGGAVRAHLERRPIGGAVDMIAGDDVDLVTGYDLTTHDGTAEVLLPAWVSPDSLVTGYRFWDASLTD